MRVPPKKHTRLNYKLIERLASVGLTDKEIATVLNIKYNTFQGYKAHDEKLQQALETGQQDPNRKVENALYKRALGYDYLETTKELTKKGTVVTKLVKKHLPADVKAAEIWLRNRMPERWNTPQRFSADLTLRDMSDLARVTN